MDFPTTTFEEVKTKLRYIKDSANELTSLLCQEELENNIEILKIISSVNDYCLELDVKVLQIEQKFEVVVDTNKSLSIYQLELKDNLNSKETECSELTTQLEQQKQNASYQIERCESLKTQISEDASAVSKLKQDLSECQQYLNEANAGMAEAKQNLQKVKEEKCDLEITVAENDVFCQALQDHINELEEISSALMSQRDEQMLYFEQKQSKLKDSFNRQLQESFSEKSQVASEYSKMKTDFVLMQDEIDHLTSERDKWFAEKCCLNLTVEEIKNKLVNVENQLASERSVSKESKELSQSISPEKEKLDSSPKEQTPQRSVESVVEDLVLNYLKQRNISMKSASEHRITSLQKQLIEVQLQLEKEKLGRIEDRSEIDNLRSKLKKASRKAKAGITASLNSSQCLIDNSLSLNSSLTAVDDLFSLASGENRVGLGDISARIGQSRSPPSLNTSSKAVSHISAAERAAIEKLQKLSII